MPNINTTPTAVALQHTMALAGWEVDYADLDLTGDAPKVEIKAHRMDGRWLWARIDSIGRCSMETFQRESWLGRPDGAGKGRWPLCHQSNDVFLGRTKSQGARALLRNMTNYIADNALHPVAQADVRRAWGALMSTPAFLSA